MKYRLMSVVEYANEKGIQTELVGNHNGEIVKQKLTGVKDKVNEKWIKDTIAKELKLKTSDIMIPKHIQDTIKRKE